MNRSAVATALAVTLLAAGAFAYSAVGAKEALPVASHDALDPSVELTAIGDMITFHMRLYDSEAHLLYSTRGVDRPLLEEAQAAWTGENPYLLPLTTDDTPQRHEIQDGLSPIPFDTKSAVPVGSSLTGKAVGDVIALPVVGSMEGWTGTQTLDRARGPFNLTMDAPTEKLRNISTTDGEGRVHIDDALVADVVAVDGAVTRLRFDVTDGDVIPIKAPGFTGIVSVDEAAGQFWFELQTEVGHRFSLTQACQLGRYVLPVGSYRVTDVTEDQIFLDHTPTKWPQLLGCDLIMIIEIHSIEPPVSE